MLKLSADIAVQAADTQIMSEAIDLMDRFFEIDEPEIRLAGLMAAVKNINPSSEPSAFSRSTNIAGSRLNVMITFRQLSY